MFNSSPFMSLPGITPEEYAYLSSSTAGLTEEQVRMFIMFYAGRRKNPDDLMLYCILGFLIPGLPRFLTNQVGMGVLYFLTAGLCFVGTIIDLINYKSLAFEYNQRMVFECIRLIRMGNL